MVYIVRINYTEFEFMSGATAMTFAELAKAAIIGESNVEIELKYVPPTDTKDDIAEALDEEEE